jgi:TM2 domain-containing membrane protein YozV
MGAIYCEPCIAARLQGSAPAQPVVPVAVVEGAPSPGLAAFLGFIPGVGAMYNGQFVKAFIHVVIVILLIVAARHYLLFLLLIFAFEFYMIFEAHQTAKALQLGRPLPDPLGLEQLFGIQENQARPRSTAASSQATAAQTPSEAQPLGRAPTSAVVLIVLGIIFLVGEKLGMDTVWPFFLIFLGLWLAYKRTLARG